jgi:hypothetical protein
LPGYRKEQNQRKLLPPFRRRASASLRKEKATRGSGAAGAVLAGAPRIPAGSNSLKAGKPSDPDGPAKMTSERHEGRKPATATDPQEAQTPEGHHDSHGRSGARSRTAERAQAARAGKNGDDGARPGRGIPGAGRLTALMRRRGTKTHERRPGSRIKKLLEPRPTGDGPPEENRIPRELPLQSPWRKRAGCRRRGPASDGARPRAERRTPTQSPVRLVRL